MRQSGRHEIVLRRRSAYRELISRLRADHSPYCSTGKRVAEALTYGYHRQDGVDVRVSRIFNCYGSFSHRHPLS